MNIGDTGRIRWVRVGRWLLAATPVHGPRVYRVLTRREQAQLLCCEAWEPDVALWGARPKELLTEYQGKPPPAVGPAGIGRDAGLAEKEDTYLSEWEPSSDGDEGIPPESQFFHPITLAGHDLNSEGRRTQLSFTERELVVHYHEANGRPLVTCGWCEAKMRSRKLHDLIRWFHNHDCHDCFDNRPPGRKIH